MPSFPTHTGRKGRGFQFAQAPLVSPLYTPRPRADCAGRTIHPRDVREARHRGAGQSGALRPRWGLKFLKKQACNGFPKLS